MVIALYNVSRFDLLKSFRLGSTLCWSRTIYGKWLTRRPDIYNQQYLNRWQLNVLKSILSSRMRGLNLLSQDLLLPGLLKVSLKDGSRTSQVLKTIAQQGLSKFPN